MIDREQWALSLKQRTPRVQGLHQIARAAPPMEVLTQSEEWNTYVSYLQAQLEKAENEILLFTEKLLSPGLWDHTEMVRIKAAILTLQERATTLKASIEIPKHIIDSGKRVDELLALDSENEAGKVTST